MASSQCILVLLDGVADRAQEKLQNRTPLMAAATPNLDRLASLGSCGRFHALTPGACLSSEAAHFFMMGYDPREFPGRGYLEALGHGYATGPGEVCLLANLALCQPGPQGLMLVERKPTLPPGQAQALMEAVAGYEGPLGRARLHFTKGSGGILILSGDIAPQVTDTDPMLAGQPVLEPLPWEECREHPPAQACAQLLRAYVIWAHRELAAHPINQEREAAGQGSVNAVLTQRAGQFKDLDPLELRWGLKVLSLSSAPIYQGVFQALGASARLLPEDPDPGRDLAAKIDLALEVRGEFDLIHVHSKAPDEAGHRHDPAHKQEVIASLDQGLARLAALAGRQEGLLVAVTGDHATPSSGPSIHSGEASPLLLVGPGVWRDNVSRFDEVSCAAGALGLLRGRELMLYLLAAMDRGKLHGLRDHPQDLPHYPGPRQALTLE